MEWRAKRRCFKGQECRTDREGLDVIGGRPDPSKMGPILQKFQLLVKGGSVRVVCLNCEGRMASKVAAAASKAVAVARGAAAEGYQYPWRDKLNKYKNELAKGVWGYWELGAWKPSAISARRRARLRKEVLLAGEDWTYDPPRKEMRKVRKGHKCDRVAAEKRAHTAELMKKMPEMLLDYKKRRWEKKMKQEEDRKKD